VDTAVSEVIGPRLQGLSPLELRDALEAGPALRQVDVLQYLIDVAHDELDRRPGRALEIMDALMPFAETIEPEQLSTTLFRANALKVHALALRVTQPARAGQQIKAALDLIDQDKQPHLHARLQLAEALVLDAGDGEPRALALARMARGTFEELGDRSMVLMARQIEAAVLTSLHREPEAQRVFEAALHDARSLADVTSETRLLHNLGLLLARQGRLGDAAAFFSRASEGFRSQGMHAEAARARWGGARILLTQGRYEDALAELDAVRSEMEAAGCGQDSVSVSLDVARTLTLLDRSGEARTVCLDAADWFSAAGFPARVSEALEQLRAAWPAAEDSSREMSVQCGVGFSVLSSRFSVPPPIHPDRTHLTGSGPRAENREPVLRRLGYEEGDAERLLGELLQSQYRFEQARVARKPRFRTAAVARRICDAAHLHRDDDPRFALSLAAAAARIAERLIEHWEDEETIRKLTGSAWSAYGAASLNLNRLDEALEAYAKAEEAYGGLIEADAPLAKVRMGRAIVHWTRDDWASALGCVRSAASTFAEHHDMPRLFEAKQVEALILGQKGEGAAACSVYEMMLAFAKTMNDRELQGRATLNLANARLDAGDAGTAKSHFLDAVGIFERLGAPGPLARARTGIARAELVAGRPDRAASLLRKAEADLRGLGFSNEANAAKLDLAEALLMLQKHDEVCVLVSSLVSTFRAASTVSGAVTAASFLADAARGHRLTPQQVQHVRDYLLKLQRNPDLLFLPPP
jgi:tetratricopeptide (TPR) repeat protein